MLPVVLTAADDVVGLGGSANSVSYHARVRSRLRIRGLKDKRRAPTQIVDHRAKLAIDEGRGHEGVRFAHDESLHRGLGRQHLASHGSGGTHRWIAHQDLEVRQSDRMGIQDERAVAAAKVDHHLQSVGRRARELKVHERNLGMCARKGVADRQLNGRQGKGEGS